MNKSPTEWLHNTLIRLIADTDDSMEFMGSVFNPKDSAQRKVSKSLERAELAILNQVEAIVNQVIGENEPVTGSGTTQHIREVRNRLRAEQRTLAKELLGDSNE